MAPLRQLAIGSAALAVMGLAGCNGDSEVGTFSADVYDVDVDCEGGDCVDVYGEAAEFESLHGFAFLTTETSAHHPDGLFVYFEVGRADGAFGRGELDIALDGVGETTVRYSETLDSSLLFVAEEAVGVIEVPEEALGEQCDCLDGRFELVLYDAEGRTRRLSRGRFGWEDRACVERARFTEIGDPLMVIPRTCGDAPVRTPGTYDPPPRDPPSSHDPYDSGWDSSACNGTTSGSAGCGSAGASGCGSGGGGCDGGGGGGCEGDVGGAGGCGGDVGGGGGCAGDTGGCRVAGHRRSVGPRGPLQTALLIGAAIAWVIRPRRRR